MILLPRKCTGKAKKKDDLETESGRGIWHAQEVCWGRRFSVNKDIRGPVLPFVRLSSVYYGISHTALRSSLVLLKSFFIGYDLFILFLFSDIFPLLLLLISIKALYRSVNQGLDPQRPTAILLFEMPSRLGCPNAILSYSKLQL